MFIRSVQFPEDSGALAHPIRPDSYHRIDNFFTATVYCKGAEVVRMYEKILGKESQSVYMNFFYCFYVYSLFIFYSV